MLLLCVCTVQLRVSTSTVRSGYRLKAGADQDSMKVLYYVEKELAQFPSAQMAARKRKPAKFGPIPFICVSLRECVHVFLLSLVCMFCVHSVVQNFL